MRVHVCVYAYIDTCVPICILRAPVYIYIIVCVPIYIYIYIYIAVYADR